MLKEFTCKYCSRPFVRKLFPSSVGHFDFCSPACRNKARILKNVPCPVCGTMFKPKIMDSAKGQRKRYCSQECAWKAQIGQPSTKRTPKKIREIIKTMYPKYGAEFLAKKLGLAISSIQAIAYKEGVKLNPDIYYKKVHKAAQEYMTENNPMKNEEVVKKVRDYRKAHPEVHERIMIKLLEGHQRIQKDKPTKLEQKLFAVLDSLQVPYEQFYLIKPKFIVDVKIDNLIIQADGDYWHGHPRFEPLTERQAAQQKRDKAQDAYLQKCGYTVIRIWEKELAFDKIVSILKNHNLLKTSH